MGALVSDFQHLYQLDFMGVFRGDLSPRRALYLIEGLANYPESIYRAEVSGMEGVVGYDRNSVILADLVDTVNNLTYATMKAAKAPKVRQSRVVWGLKKLNANIRKTAEFRTTRLHRP